MTPTEIFIALAASLIAAGIVLIAFGIVRQREQAAAAAPVGRHHHTTVEIVGPNYRPPGSPRHASSNDDTMILKAVQE